MTSRIKIVVIHHSNGSFSVRKNPTAPLGPELHPDTESFVFKAETDAYDFARKQQIEAGGSEKAEIIKHDLMRNPEP